MEAPDITKSRVKKKKSFFDPEQGTMTIPGGSIDEQPVQIQPEQVVDEGFNAKIAAGAGGTATPTPVQQTNDFGFDAKIAAGAGVQAPVAAPTTGRTVLFPEQAPQEKTAQDYLNELFSAQMPKPEFDEKRPEELRRLQKSNAMAKGFNLIGDMVALSKNAKVNRRPGDNAEAKYANDLFRYMDDYANKIDQWNYRDYNNKQQNAIMGMNAANREAELETQNKRLDAELERWNKQFKQSQDQAEQAKINADRNFGLDQEQLKNQKEHQGAVLDWQKQSPAIEHGFKMEEIKAQTEVALQKYRAKVQYDAEKGDFKLYTKQGQPVASLDEGEISALAQIILKDTVTQQMAENDLVLMKGMFEGLSKQQQLSIIAYYYDQSPDALKFLSQKAKEPSNTTGYIGNPQDSTQTAPPPEPPAQDTTQDDEDINQWLRK